ncbi:MAG TPA: HTTM domain-containing protein, partial [Polyangiaceae bacterium]|nr:HTTM domain-containing protein [Polyangiaceae bacterium]
MKERLLSWWFAPLPARRLALLRIFVGAFALIYSAVRAPSMTSVAEFAAARFEPVGVAALLHQPLPAGALLGGVALSLLLGAAFTVGFRFSVTGPAFALVLLCLTTYRSSWGMIFHTENLLTLHVMLLAASPASDALSWDARARRQAPHDAADGRYGWAIQAMSLITVVAYFVAGIAKLKLSGGTWLGGELLRAQIAYDNLRKLELGTRVSPLGPWLVRHAFVFPPLALLTMLVELGAPLALLNRRVALAWLIAAWCFHLGVLTTMSIAFIYQLSGVAYLSFLPLEQLLERLQARLQKSSVSPSGTA